MDWILVTGFSAFENHPDNPSTKAVKELPSAVVIGEGEDGSRNVDVVKLELRVSYKTVDDLYANQLLKLQPSVNHSPYPLIIVHVGVAGKSDQVRLEQQAYNEVKGLDVDGQEPIDKVVNNRDQVGNILSTQLSVSLIQNHVKTALNIEVELSKDPGRYLCNYSYYKALTLMPQSKALFIHVPEEDRPHSIQTLSNIIYECLKSCLKQLN
ncbi:hypothetical protein MIR68_001594 [Amoeboaphelidium protococcarum]|nr:hypothetical protein MIR68_001594 [Amoeboaphelidium protococcarum]